MFEMRYSVVMDIRTKQWAVPDGAVGRRPIGRHETVEAAIDQVEYEERRCRQPAKPTGRAASRTESYPIFSAQFMRP